MLRFIPLLLVLTACNGSEFDALFGAPTGVATDSLEGTWGGATSNQAITFDTRWVLRADELTMANRCSTTNRTVGIVVAAQIDETQMRILESASDGDERCNVSASPGTTPVCPTDPALPRDGCFVHDGTLLTFFASDVDSLELTKLED